MDDNKFIKKILPVGITVFWLVMMGILISSELISKNKLTSYKPFLSKNTLFSDEWMGIYFNDSPVGFVHTSIEPCMIEKGLSGYRIVNRTFMNFFILRRRNKVWFNAEAMVDENYSLKNFNFELNSGAHSMEVKGRMMNKRLMELSINSQGVISQRRIQLQTDQGVVIANIISPFSSFGTLRVGERYNVKVFNPFSLALEPLEISISGKEVITHNAEQVETYVVRSDYRGLEQIAWVNEKGEILKEVTGLGWVLIKEDAQTANRIYDAMKKTDVELAELVSVNAGIRLPEGNVKFLKLLISGIEDEFYLKSQRQSIKDAGDNKKIIEITKDKVSAGQALPLPIKHFSEFLGSSDFIQSNNKDIKARTRQIVGNEKNSFTAVKKINQWVFKNIRKVPVVSIPSAVDVLKTREGDCNEHSVLFVALARAAGIPAKINVGLAYASGRFYYHAWASAFIGSWIDIDPTFGQDIADAAHIKLIEGDLDKQLDIVKLLGKIKLEVIEYK